jgi:hypothetical protein
VDILERVTRGETLERYCELVIIAGWISTAVNFQKILTNLSRNKLLLSSDKDVWTLIYLRHAIDRYSGVTNGPGPRTQPWFNFSITHGDLIEGLRILRGVIVDSASGNGTYADMHLQVRQIVGVGYLGAQHIIGVLSLGGMIPPKFQDIATICVGTNTAKKIATVYGLSTPNAEKLK